MCELWALVRIVRPRYPNYSRGLPATAYIRKREQLRSDTLLHECSDVLAMADDAVDSSAFDGSQGGGTSSAFLNSLTARWQHLTERT